MKTFFFAITTLFLLTAGYSQPSRQLLDSAYEKKSIKLLKQFFQNWNKEIKPITEIELSKMNDTIKQTYSLFSKFYKPHRIKSLGGSEWGNNIYKGVDFLIVQNLIRIYFTKKLHYTEQEIDDYVVEYINKHVKEDSTKQKMLKRKNGKLSKSILERYQPERRFYYKNNDSLTYSIVDFRPRINCKGKPLYMTSNYENILNTFLGSEHLPLAEGGLMNPARSAGESEKRKIFLEKYIKIWYGHWGGYWQLYSYPCVESITFDSEMKYAIINFTMVYEGGEALLKNKNGRWKLISAQITWIE